MALLTPNVLVPTDEYNWSSKPIVSWTCVPNFNIPRVVLHDSNGIRFQDIRYRPTTPPNCSIAGWGIGHDIPAPWPGEPNGRFVKGLLPGHYELELHLEDGHGHEITSTKGFDIVPNIDHTFGAGASGRWYAERGDWGSISAYTFGCRGRTAGLRDLAFFDSPVYSDERLTSGRTYYFDESHTYSYTASFKINSTEAACKAGPALAVGYGTGREKEPGKSLYGHTDFLVSGTGLLTIQDYNEGTNGGEGRKIVDHATIDLAPFVDVHDFFSLRIEFNITTGATALFVNERKIFIRNLGSRLMLRSSGACGFVYESQNVANSFEVERLFVRPSIWESIGVFKGHEIE